MKYKMGLTDKKPGSRKKRGRSASRKSIRVKPGNLSKSKSRRRNKSGLRKFAKFSKISNLWSGLKKNKGPGRPKKKTFGSVVKKVFKYLTVTGFVLGALSAIALGVYLKSLQNSLPDPDGLIDRNNDKSTIIYSRDGKELYKIYADENREFVPIDEVPDHTKWAFLAAEDVEFYQHKGLDWKGIIRCSYLSAKVYIVGEGNVCGASTVSQQLVRNTLMYEAFGEEAFERENFWKAARRKMREMLLTMQVEKTLTKDEILQLYLNEIWMGSVNYGVQSASKAYLGKDIQELTLAESALLAGMVQSPGEYAPLYGVETEAGIERQQYVLDQMDKYSNLTGVEEEQLVAAKDQEIKYKTLTPDIPAYHFVFYVRQQLEELYGPELVSRGGLKVTTTLDMSTQIIAEEEIANGIKAYGHDRGIYNGAMVAIDPKTGQILAMVGSVDPQENEDPRIDGSVNVTTSPRQMGSSVKPYTYFTAFQEYGPWMAAPDVRGMTFGNYDPPNWDNRTQGIMTAREALVKSRNKPAVYTLQTVGITPVMQNMEKMGITTLTNPNQYGLSFTLGTAEMKLLEHAGAYTIFADGGVKHDITPILKVEDSNGEVLLEYEDKKERVFSEEDTYMINWTLCDLGGHGDQAYADQGMYNINGVRAACGKTGTTDGRTDLVTIQYHRNMVAAVWAGNNNNDEGTSQAWSTTVPLPIVHSFMERVSRDYPSKLYSRPANVREATVCKDTGRMASDGVKCPKEKTVYVKDRQPPKDKREVVHVCKSNDMIASNYEQAKEFDIIKDRMYLNFTPENSQQLKTLKRFYEGRKSGGLKILFNEPKEAVCELPLGPDGEPVVEITSPSSGFSIGAGETLRINADVRAGNDVDRVELLFDGDLIESTTDNEAPFELEYQIPSGTPSGEYLVSIRAVDSEGKIGTTSINISVVNEGTSIEWLNPADGDTFSLPANLEVEILGFNPNSVVFVIEGDGSTYSNTIMDTDGSDGWSVSWDDSLASPGNYTIQARAVNGVNVITSATISVTVN